MRACGVTALARIPGTVRRAAPCRHAFRTATRARAIMRWVLITTIQATRLKSTVYSADKTLGYVITRTLMQDQGGDQRGLLHGQARYSA
jgi:hypothetical protein